MIKQGMMAIILAISGGAWAAQVPVCLDAQGNPLSVNNAQVLAWKASTPDRYRNRAHILGVITRIYRDATGHHHWEVQLSNVSRGTVEVIYDEKFGPVPQAQIGMTVEACGDYITSPQGGSWPSPDGAIVHWIHISDTSRHPSGYLILNGQLCGQNLPYGQNNHHGYTVRHGYLRHDGHQFYHQ